MNPSGIRRRNMLATVRAVYESTGILRLLQPVDLKEGQEVEISLELSSPASDSAFDLAALAVDGGQPDLAHEHNHYLYGTPKQGSIHDR
jgi:predicted DNA-binding antitoxin AbrB/MazE fold protein